MTSDQQSLNQYPCVELISNYRKGGYHPIHIDDVLHNRYRIVNKLGYGAYATVWLVEDLNSGKFAALKVRTADFSKDDSEVAILRHIKQRRLNGGGSNGQEFLVEFLDDFMIEGPNGTHQCIVTEVLGPTVAEDMEEIYGEEKYPIEIAKAFVTQLNRGVAYLHNCGVVHGGRSSDPSGSLF
jgi:serine/threonine-protein kinase SRPK3